MNETNGSAQLVALLSVLSKQVLALLPAPRRANALCVLPANPGGLLTTPRRYQSLGQSIKAGFTSVVSILVLLQATSQTTILRHY